MARWFPCALAKITTRFMKSLHFLNIIFAWLRGGKSTGLDDFFFFNISRLKSLNLVLMPGAKLDGYRGTWAGCFNSCKCFNDFTIKRSKRVQCFSYPGELQYWFVFAMSESYWNFNFIEQIPSSHWSFTIYEKQVPNTRPVGKEI